MLTSADVNGQIEAGTRRQEGAIQEELAEGGDVDVAGGAPGASRSSQAAAFSVDRYCIIMSSHTHHSCGSSSVAPPLILSGRTDCFRLPCIQHAVRAAQRRQSKQTRAAAAMLLAAARLGQQETRGVEARGPAWTGRGPGSSTAARSCSTTRGGSARAAMRAIWRRMARICVEPGLCAAKVCEPRRQHFPLRY